MAAIGINLKIINASKSQDILNPVNVSNKTKIKDVREKDIPAIGQKCMVVNFVYNVDYMTQQEKSLAMIEIEGEVFYMDGNQKAILDGWKKDKKLPENLNIELLNLIMRRCATKSLVLAEDLQLPPPIALPLITKKMTEKK